MSELLNSETFGDKIYDRFPEVYKRDDKLNNYALKRYVKTAGDGFKCVIDEVNGITDLRDSDKVDSKILPVIYSSHGLDIFNGIPETYLRNLVPTLNPLFSRKGSISAIEYLCSVVSGILCTVEMSRFSENNQVNVLIDMDNTVQKNFPNVEQLRRIVDEFVPFYCNVSLVFSYSFKDTFGIVIREQFEDNEYTISDKESPNFLFSEVLEDEITSKREDSADILNDSYKENSNFLNNPRLLLTNNIFLNSCNGYDTITINGVVIDTLAYNF